MNNERQLNIAKEALLTISSWNNSIAKKENLTRDICVASWRECIKIAREALDEISELDND